MKKAMHGSATTIQYSKVEYGGCGTIKDGITYGILCIIG